MGTEYILELKHISKSFPGVKALDDVTLCVRPGTVHSLMGENGAGKSTLMKCLFGIYSFDEGEIILDGKNIKFSSPSEALQNHVSMVHQELNQVLNQTVMENMWLGRFPMKHGLVDDQKMYEDTKAIFDDLDIQVNPKVKIGTLKVSQKQMIEIAKAVSYNSKVIVMDEPTSSLTEKEVEHNFKNIFAQSSTKIIIALAAGMVLVVQGVDLSTGRMIGLAAVIFASLVQNPDYAYRMYPNLKELPLIVPLLLVLAICLVLGGISGVLVAVFKVPPFIATLGMQLILYGASSIYFDRPPYGAQPIGGIDSKVTQIAIGSIGIGDFQIPYLIIIAAAVCVVMWIVWNKTKFGKYMFAVGGNPEAAKVSGVNVIKTQIMVYAIAGMMYAFAAALEVGRIGSASNTTGNGYEMDAVAACVIGGVSLSGGVGSVGGIVIGVLMFTVINYGLAFIGVNMYWQYIVKGLIILLAVIIDMRKYAKRK